MIQKNSLILTLCALFSYQTVCPQAPELVLENVADAVELASVGELYQRKSLERIPFLNDNEIEECKITVMNDSATNALKRNGIIAVASVAAVIAAYKIVFEKSGRKPFEPKQDDVPVSREEFNELNVGFQRFQYAIDPDWFTWQWCKNWGKNIGKGLVSMAATKHLFDMGERSLQAIFHDDTFAWFIKNRTRYLTSMSELNVYAQKIDAGSLSSAEQDHYNQQIICIARSIVHDMALISAFMHFQLTRFPFSEIALQEGNDLRLYLKTITNNFVDSLQRALSDQTGCVSVILKFSQEFEKIAVSFTRVEQEQYTCA